MHGQTSGPDEVVSEGFGHKIRRRDLDTLNDSAKLNDEVSGCAFLGVLH